MIRNFLAILALAGLASCGNVVEEITIEADGTGTYEIKTDIIPATVNMAVTMTKMFSSIDSTKTLNEDSLQMAVLEEVWADFGDEEIDSTLDVMSQMPDSLLKTDADRKYAEGMNMFMRGSRDKGYMNMGVEYAFADAEDFQGFMEFWERLQASSGNQQTGSPLDDLGDMRSKVEIVQTSNSFSRKTEYLNPIEDDSELEGMAELLGDGKYITVVKTKRKIKKVNGEHIKDIDDYSVTFEYPFVDAFSGALNTDFEIIFEKK